MPKESEVKEVLTRLSRVEPGQWISRDDLAREAGLTEKKTRDVLNLLNQLHVPIEEGSGGRIRMPPRSNPVLSLPPGEWFTTRKLAEKLGVTEYKARKMVEEAKKLGLPVETRRGKGTRLSLAGAEPDHPDPTDNRPQTTKSVPSPAPRDKRTPREADASIPGRKGKTEKAKKRRWPKSTGKIIGLTLAFVIVGSLAMMGSAVVQRVYEKTFEALFPSSAPAATVEPAPRQGEDTQKTLARIADNLESTLKSVQRQLLAVNQRLNALEKHEKADTAPLAPNPTTEEKK